jgi:hypothetical protein
LTALGVPSKDLKGREQNPLVAGALKAARYVLVGDVVDDGVRR